MDKLSVNKNLREFKRQILDKSRTFTVVFLGHPIGSLFDSDFHKSKKV